MDQRSLQEDDGGCEHVELLQFYSEAMENGIFWSLVYLSGPHAEGHRLTKLPAKVSISSAYPKKVILMRISAEKLH